jgi:hypothetical protein
MRKVGLILLAAGLAGFLFASAQRSRYEKALAAPSPAEALTPALSQDMAKARQRVEGWETARWVILGAAVMGLVFTVLPGKES